MDPGSKKSFYAKRSPIQRLWLQRGEVQYVSRTADNQKMTNGYNPDPGSISDALSSQINLLDPILARNESDATLSQNRSIESKWQEKTFLIW